MYKVLALDLDGTVLSDDHTIHPQVKDAIRAAQQHCHVLIVTGRHHTAARPYYDELGLTTPIICCNGTYVYDYASETVLEHNAIDKQDALTFIDLAQEFQLKLVMYIKDAMTYSQRSPIAYMQALEKWRKRPLSLIRRKFMRLTPFTKLRVTLSLYGNLSSKVYQAQLSDS